jgi:ABC-2 type transport system ATP-binding protein
VDAIKIVDLRREFGELTAVDDVNINIEVGELFGLLGPNGAGKTTIIRILSTLLNPTSGYAEVWGHDVSKEHDAVRRAIGVVFQDPSVDNKLTGRENLNFHARMYGMEKGLRRERIDEVLSLVELEDKANVLLEDYSGGMQRRLEIARGLMHRPNVLFLDEPTLGLDAQTRRYIWDYVRRLKEEGVTIVLTTHYMEEADYLCNRVAFIDHGRIVAMDEPKNLKRLIQTDLISLRISDHQDDLFDTLKKFEWINDIEEHDGFLDLRVEDAHEHIAEIVITAKDEGVTITSISMQEPTLEDVFLRFTGRKIREGEDAERLRRQIRARRK